MDKQTKTYEKGGQIMPKDSAWNIFTISNYENRKNVLSLITKEASSLVTWGFLYFII